MHRKTTLRKNNNSATRSICASLVVILLFIAVSVQSYYLRSYRIAELPVPDGRLREASPLANFVTVALGGFRGLIADLLWLHASDLQEQRRFVELVQLSDWITILEPDNGDVWSFHAWNLAYNVSVMMTRPEDAWRWVRNGIELLRKQAIRYNPRNARIYRELAWMYQHKIGMTADPNSWLYRTELAEDISQYLDSDGSAPSPMSLKAAGLVDNYSLDAGKMLEIQDQFGHIDWRVPHAQAVYWAIQGLALNDKNESLPCCRIVYQSLVAMIQGWGILAGDPASPDYKFNAFANTGLIDRTVEYIDNAFGKYKFNGIKAAQTGILVEAAKIRYLEGRVDEARAYYSRAQTNFMDVKYELPPLEDLVSGVAEIDWERVR